MNTETAPLRTSAELGELAKALAVAQAQIRSAAKTGNNPRFGPFADMGDVIAACRTALTGAGLAVIQAPSNVGDNIAVTTRLIHTSGQWVESTLSARPSKNDAQQVGSVVTYLRRYSLASLVGVAAGDDDGESAVGQQHRREPQRPRVVENNHHRAKHHHPSWEADRAAFRAWACNLLDPQQAGDTAAEERACELVSEWTASKDWGRPSGWTQDQRNNFRRDIAAKPDDLLAWLDTRRARQNRATGGE